MFKYVLACFIFFTVILNESYAQTAPALLSSTYSAGSNFFLLNIQYIPHDTGVITAQVIMQQGTGSTVYDSTYYFTSHAVLDTDSATLFIGPLLLCGTFTLNFDLGNDSLQGIEYNPLYNVNLICTAIDQPEADNFKLITQGHLIEIESRELLPNGVAEIYDMTGRKVAGAVLNQPTENVMLDAASGIYLLRIMSAGQTVYTTKVAMY